MVYRFIGFSFHDAGLVVAILVFSLMVGFFFKSLVHWLGKKIEKTELDIDIESLKKEHTLQPPQKEILEKETQTPPQLQKENPLPPKVEVYLQERAVGKKDSSKTKMILKNPKRKKRKK